MVVGGSRQETMDLGFVLSGTRQQGVPVILRELVLPGGYDPVLPSLTKTTSVAAVGLNIHKGNSKILRYNTLCTNPITIDGEDLEDVKSFTYLSSIIDEHGGSDADVKARIGQRKRGRPNEHITLRNGDRHEKNEQELDGTRKEGRGQSGLENGGRRPMLH
ncbi:unnamed protein product [Schistosoma curassoni]|uniref:GMC_OxRdtase_N domain-containing protein n=1 Tax=Schistosoma curassoni TaxID=6186 RepID=A0A183KL99_9TREM|nr:unnamed protein product [Schistosoma curassoni]